ncbi:hypothetical protein [Kitasatospora purpeofusca]|uniref:hypothetical protein n=1 Tax=Kitasatospora purpeofusca TaxID=67352 RepID=UPI0022597AD9|nr:hypothetical protein [Kitasatospora purpeofusca]MCX4753178.1 hypothetical protein [Kitasatospora purpeofusca]WSR32701.1 hypothetical protein OG715_17945 [Kitasatospora purpeofusca]WSR40793.1 hypothetical protein OG196_17755 [Kitasatospora purpeofusca]
MTRGTSPLRRPLAAAALVGLAVLAAGCGIRPTAVPVDAGAPASRTACPTVARIPTAPGTPSGAVGGPPQAAAAHGTPTPTAPAAAAAPVPTQVPTTPVRPAPTSGSPAASPSPSPSVVSPTASAAPTGPADNVFGALPSPSAPTTAPPCR